MILYIALIGLCIGSFINVVVYRVPINKSIMFPSSSCIVCNNKIKWYDNMPILSYLLLGGKCRNCKTKISKRYPLTELCVMSIFILMYIAYGFTFEFFKYITLGLFIIVIGLIDYDTTYVYCSITYLAMITGAIFILIEKLILKQSINTYLIATIVVLSLTIFIVYILKGMGSGDIEICAVVAMFLGLSSTILVLFLSTVIAGIVSIILINLKMKSKKDYIPFGPFIAISTIVVVLYGTQITNWYFSLLT